MKQIFALILFLTITAGYLFSAESTVFREKIQFKSGEETLFGEFIIPQNRTHIPLLVFLPGSGPTSSYRTNYANFLKEILENQLLDKGIALMYFDKRGVAPSTGKWYQTDFFERAEDAYAAIKFAKSTGRFDSCRIGVIGHSQGGWIVQIIAAQYSQEVRCMVSLSGATFDVKRQLINDYQSENICKGMDSIRANRKARKRAAFDLRFVSLFPVTQGWKQLKLVKTFDPAQSIEKIKCPALFTFAGNDNLVYPQWCMQSLHNIFPGGTPANFTVKTFIGVNHSYRVTEFCSRGKYKQASYSGEFKEYFTNWILNNL